MKTIGILGIGRLGLCFALNLERNGYRVIGVDVNQPYVDAINQKTLGSHEPGVKELLAASKNLIATTHFAEVIHDDVDTLFIMVATPTGENGGYDHAQVEHVISELKKFGPRKKSIDLVIGCTVMPGYCDELAERLTAYNYLVNYNPEFIAQGNIINNQVYPDQILIGEANENSGKKLAEICAGICRNNPPVQRLNRMSAEIAKLAINCFLTTKISFANAVGDVATTVGADVDDLLRVVGADSRIGARYLKYGFGYGGSCLPRDNRAMNLFARNEGYELLLSTATDESNKRHLQFQVNQYLKNYPDNQTIIFEGIAFKEGSVLLDESQKLELALQLVKRGRKVKIIDRQIVIEEINRLHPGLFITEAVG